MPAHDLKRRCRIISLYGEFSAGSGGHDVFAGYKRKIKRIIICLLKI